MEEKKMRIYNCGKELFSTKGFKDTTVADITGMAGVAVGTFYNYYPSKEKLFMDIFLEENEKLKRKCLEALDLNRAPIDVVKQMVALNIQGMLANPILCQWFNPGVYDKLERLFRDENGMHKMNFLYDCFL
ncbi:MAG TPA: TetR/AcrR family transcriptional regulator, partial [Bacillota bacterium]|nr:TetR/AcrR family transcriptional regulator [Bacillota bacterium]